MRNPRESTRLLIRVSEVRDLYGLSTSEYLAPLCNQKYQSTAQRGQLLKYQPHRLWPAGILFASPTISQGYNFLTDNAKETLSLAAPGKETSFLAAPLTLAEYVSGGGAVKTQTAIQIFLQSRQAKNLKPKTIQWYEAQLTKFASFYPELPLEPAPLEEFLMHISGTPETRHGYYRTLKALYRFIARRCHCPNPIEFVDPPRCPKKCMPTLEPHEMMQLLELARNFRDRVLLTLFIDTGARASELAGLQKQDIQADSIIVRGKTGEREIPISDEPKRLLLCLISADGKSEYVFTGSQGRPLTRYGIYILIRKLMRKAGISTPKLGPHRIRHGFGKGYLVNGGDIRSLQLIMGHADISTTEKYASLNLNDLQIKHRKFTPLRAAHAAAQERFLIKEV